eukprot:jgi/Mesvir1/16134/Mv08411-RA.1
MADKPPPRVKRETGDAKAEHAAPRAGSAGSAPATSETTSKARPPASGSQASGAGEAGPSIGFTTGGLKKTKFTPKVPARRVVKKSQSEGEPADGEGGEGTIEKELHRILQQAQEMGHDKKKGLEPPPGAPGAPVRVAFGFGSGTAARASMMNSYRVGEGGVKGHGGGGGGGGGSGGGHFGRIKEELEEHLFDAEEIDPDDLVEKEFNYDFAKYYPVQLPFQEPGAPAAATLRTETPSSGFVETDTTAAEELELDVEADEERFFLFQIPEQLPMEPVVAADATMRDGTGAVERGPTEKAAPTPAVKLQDLQGGLMGKLLVYESGAVRMQLGGTDIVWDAEPGIRSSFYQELVGIRADGSNHACYMLGRITDKVILAPNIDSLLEADAGT